MGPTFSNALVQGGSLVLTRGPIHAPRQPLANQHWPFVGVAHIKLPGTHRVQEFFITQGDISMVFLSEWFQLLYYRGAPVQQIYLLGKNGSSRRLLI